MTAWRKTLIVAILGVLLVAWWQAEDRESDGPRGTDGSDLEPLVNRVWIDHIPRGERDKIDVMVMVDEPQAGGFATTSQFEGDWSSFEWYLDGGLKLRMLQADKVHKVKAVVIKGSGCKGFDYCLRLSGAPRGSRTYGSMEDWVLAAGQTDPQAAARQLTRSLTAD